MQQDFNELIKQIIGKNVKTVFKRGVIVAVDINNWTADVRFVDNTQTTIRGVKLSSAIPTSVMIGDRCRIDLFDENNPNDMVVAYLYGRKP